MRALITSVFVTGSLLTLQPSWANPNPLNDPKSACEVFARNRLGGSVTAPEVQKWLVNCQNRVRDICMGMTKDAIAAATAAQKDRLDMHKAQISKLSAVGKIQAIVVAFWLLSFVDMLGHHGSVGHPRLHSTQFSFSDFLYFRHRNHFFWWFVHGALGFRAFHLPWFLFFHTALVKPLLQCDGKMTFLKKSNKKDCTAF